MNSSLAFEEQEMKSAFGMRYFTKSGRNRLPGKSATAGRQAPVQSMERTRMEDHRMKALIRNIGAIVLSMSFTACGKTIDWKQEVKLHDGRVIVVDRQSKQESMSIPTKGILEPWQQIAFTHPALGERIVWDLPKGLGLWMLDIEGETIWTVLKPQSVADYNNWGCPSPPWIVFRRQAGIWQQVSMGDMPSVFVAPNTLAAAASDNPRSENKLVSVEQFGAYLARLDPEYRTISREKVNPIAHGCHESVLHRQGRQSEIDNRR